MLYEESQGPKGKCQEFLYMEAGCGNPQQDGGLQSLRRVGIRMEETVTRHKGAAEEEE